MKKEYIFQPLSNVSKTTPWLSVDPVSGSTKYEFLYLLTSLKCLWEPTYIAFDISLTLSILFLTSSDFKEQCNHLPESRSDSSGHHKTVVRPSQSNFPLAQSKCHTPVPLSLLIAVPLGSVDFILL